VKQSANTLQIDGAIANPPALNIQDDLTFLIPAYRGCHGEEAVKHKQASVSICLYVFCSPPRRQRSVPRRRSRSPRRRRYSRSSSSE